MDITIQSRIHPNRILKLIAINRGNETEVRYAGSDEPVGFVASHDPDEIEAYVRLVLRMSGGVFEIIPTAPRYREVVLYLHNGSIHHIRVRRKGIARDYFPAAWPYYTGSERAYNCIMEVIMRNSVPVIIAEAVEPYTIRMHKGIDVFPW